MHLCSILHTHTPTSPSLYFTNTNNIIDYIFSIYRFAYVSKAWGIEPKDFDPILNKYIEDTTQQGTSDGFTGGITQVHLHMNSREQFDMLGTVSNYHGLGFPSLRHPQKIKTLNISLYEHMATPENKRYIPTSPRNCIIYFIKSGEKEHLRNYLKFLQVYDHTSRFQTDEPPCKKPWLTGRVKRVDAFRVKQKYLSPELVEMIQKSNIERSVYTKFKNQILTSGTIKWHHSEEGRNVCVMNDYSLNGHLIPNYFVHVSRECP